jgi:hypothetical protein
VVNKDFGRRAPLANHGQFRGARSRKDVGILRKSINSVT